MSRILLVEDEENIRAAVKLNLELDGYDVIAVDHGKKAMKAFHEQHFDLVILDVMLPEIDGFQICDQIRVINAEIPVLFLTAKDSPRDRVTGLKRGADDYLTKPFNIEELQLRISNLIKRSKRAQDEAGVDTYTFQNGQWINFQTYVAKGQHGEFNLTKKEAMLLKLLVERKDEVVSRNQILQTVWGYDVYPSTRTIDNFILSFRKYFEPDPKEPLYFHSVRGVGYKFTE
jgi:two-component system alkaline phosphatase synthesis response regulator PhoP